MFLYVGIPVVKPEAQCIGLSAQRQSYQGIRIIKTDLEPNMSLLVPFDSIYISFSPSTYQHHHHLKVKLLTKSSLLSVSIAITIISF